MAGGTGYFWAGAAEGVSTGIDWHNRIFDLQERKRARQEIEERKKKTASDMIEMGKLFDNLDKSSNMTQEQRYKFSAAFHAFGEEVQSQYKGAYSEIMNGNYNEAKSQVDYVNSMFESILPMIEDVLKYGDIDSLLGFMESSITTEEGKRYFDAAKGMIEQLAPIQQQASEARKAEATELTEQQALQKQYEEESKHIRAMEMEEYKRKLDMIKDEHKAVLDIQTAGAKKAAETDALLQYAPEVYTSIAELKSVHGENANFKFVPSARGGQGGYVIEAGDSESSGEDALLEELRKQLGLDGGDKKEGTGFWNEVKKFLTTSPFKYFPDLYKRMNSSNEAEKEQLKETLSDARSTAELIREEAYKRFEKMTEEQVAALAMKGDELAMQYGYEKWGKD